MNILTTPLGLLCGVLMIIITFSSIRQKDCAVDKSELNNHESGNATSVKFINSFLDSINEQGGNISYFIKSAKDILPSEGHIALVDSSVANQVFTSTDAFAICGSSVDMSVVITKHDQKDVLLSQNFTTKIGSLLIPQELETAALGMQTGDFKMFVSNLKTFPAKQLNIKGYEGKRIYDVKITINKITNGLSLASKTMFAPLQQSHMDTYRCDSQLKVLYKFTTLDGGHLSEFSVNQSLANLSKFGFNKPLLGGSNGLTYLTTIKTNDVQKYIASGIQMQTDKSFIVFEELLSKLNNNKDEVLVIKVESSM